MSGFTKLQKLLLAGLGTCGSALAFYYSFHGEKRQAYASWTTNHNPSVQWDSNWDRRDPSCLVDPRKNGTDENKYNEALKKAKPKAVRHLLLIRHGQYNLSGRIDEERKLTDLDMERYIYYVYMENSNRFEYDPTSIRSVFTCRKQAHFTGLRLQELDLPYSKLIASTMTRANETARIIQRSLPEVPFSDCPLLEEGAPIPPEPPVGNWRPEPCQFYQDGARIEAAFRKYFYRAENSQEKDTYEILVCHANVIRYFVCRALQFPPEAWLRLSLNHASITWVSITPSGRVILRSYSDAGYMPPEAITSH